MSDNGDIQVVNRLTQLRRELIRVASDIAPQIVWHSATGPTRFQELNIDEQTFVLVGIVGPAGAENEDFLDELLDSHGQHSIRLALEADRQLAGSMDLRVLSTSGARSYPQDDGQLFIGAEWKIQALFD